MLHRNGPNERHSPRIDESQDHGHLRPRTARRHALPVQVQHGIHLVPTHVECVAPEPKAALRVAPLQLVPVETAAHVDLQPGAVLGDCLEVPVHICGALVPHPICRREGQLRQRGNQRSQAQGQSLPHVGPAVLLLAQRAANPRCVVGVRDGCIVINPDGIIPPVEGPAV